MVLLNTPQGGEDISCAVALQLQKEMSEEDLDNEGELEQVYLEPEASPALPMSPVDNADSTKSDGKCDSECKSHVILKMDIVVDALDRVDLDGNVDMERYSEAKEDEVEEDEKKEEVVDEDEKEDKDEKEDDDIGKEPRTIGQGEMVNSSAADTDNLINDEPTVLPAQRQGNCNHTSRRDPLCTSSMTTNPGDSTTTTNSIDSYPQWAGVIGACDTANTSPSGAHSGGS
jgi:hypothetical protein